MPDTGDKAREEFFSEAHEIIEGLSRDLLVLDSSRGKGPTDPEIVNNIFRAVHTLKGLAGLFGATRMGDDAESSVVDRDCVLHDVPNVAVVGSSSFPTSGGYGPTATIQALAWRTSERAVASIDR